MYRVAASRGFGVGYVSFLRFAALFCLFFVIAFELGYPILNRYDSRAVPGLVDVKSYAAMVTGAPVPGHEHMRFRVLVPWVARVFYKVANGRVHTWDPVMFGLLSSDSLFVAATALLMVVLGTRQLAATRSRSSPRCSTWSILRFRICAWWGWWMRDKAFFCSRCSGA